MIKRTSCCLAVIVLLASTTASDAQINLSVDPPKWETAIRHGLERKMNFEFVNAPLEEAISFLVRETGLPMHIDKRALEDIGVSVKERVSINLPSVSIRAGLKQMLEQHEYSFFRV